MQIAMWHLSCALAVSSQALLIRGGCRSGIGRDGTSCRHAANGIVAAAAAAFDRDTPWFVQPSVKLNDRLKPCDRLMETLGL